jgi:hypothetical protein
MFGIQKLCMCSMRPEFRKMKSGMRRILPFIIVVFALASRDASAQCSDAGACAVTPMWGEETDRVPRHTFALWYIYGSSGAPDDIAFHTLVAEAGAEVFDGTRVSSRLPYTSIEGPLGSASGLGDLMLFLDQRIWQYSGMEFRAQAGVKLATGDDNAGGLPQAYQPGLGSSDLILGVSFDAAPWSTAVGYQHPAGRSENSLIRLQRGGDLLARAGYRTAIDRYGIGIEAIAIQRLSESSVIDLEASGTETFMNVPGSDQLQVNILGSFSAPLSEHLRLALLAAFPLLQRDVNIDGLKRALTLTAGIEASF